jgi:transcriptional regulator with XRE-family HTH domain
MSDTQKNTISKLLKEKGKTKRELAVFLDIHENGINRLIGNSKISMERLEQIAHFLDMDMKVLFDKIYPKPKFESPEDNSDSDLLNVRDKSYGDVEEIILLLAEVIRGQKRIKELEEKNAEKLLEMMNLMMKSF